ncbi:peroxisomal biogenesis factor 19 [Caerostris darwini]|uniref:Peroxin-19 n=1 Tax=Caerostris darwini TaxID=1538125 RepID=A0AAV4MIF3_9ARAC|nr:peroxisomal biogenesis factor 19 [Caerostris darwini]
MILRPVLFSGNKMEDKEKTKDSAAAVSGDDLSELLDSCLDDFNKPLPKTVLTNTQPTEGSSSQQPSSESDKPLDSSAWGEEFKEYSEVIENIIGAEGPELNEFKKLMDNYMTQEGPQINDEEFAKSFAKTIQEMTQQTHNIPETSPDDVANLLGSLGLGNNPDVESMPELMPIMQSVMQRLMSKDLLYPSLKEIVEKYPGWLNEKKSSFKTEEYDNYQKQYEHMKEICEEFEKDIDQSEAAKKEQFETVLKMMQKVQNYGNPPKELISSINPSIPLDEEGNLQVPGMPEQCIIM